MLESALIYERLGWSVIPIGSSASKGSKRPAVQWLSYQRTRAGPAQIRAWWSRIPRANVGIVTGRVSGLLVVDVESKDGYEALLAHAGGSLPETIRQRTGKEEGLHLFFAHPLDGRIFHNGVRVLPDVDVRGEGGYVVVAPSIHPTGRRYCWDDIDPREMGLDDLMDLPKSLEDLFRPGHAEEEIPAPDPGSGTENDDEERSTAWVNEALLGVEEGKRNDTCARLAGYLLRVHRGDCGIVENVLFDWNKRNRPPLEWKEVRKTIRSIRARQGVDELGKELGGGEIDKIQVLEYPDGIRRYNVFLKGVSGAYAQLSARELGMYSSFKWKFMEMSGFIPPPIKQRRWEEMVNEALKTAEILLMPEEETPIGIVTSVISSQVFQETPVTDISYVTNRIVISQRNGSGPSIFLTTKTIYDLVRYEGDGINRRKVGEILRNLGFKPEVVRLGNKLTRAWSKPVMDWKRRITQEMEFAAGIKRKRGVETE